MTDKKVPELRFEGFKNEWEQRKFEDSINLVGGATPYKDNKNYWHGDIIWLSSQEIKNKFVSKGTYTITEKAVTDNKTKIISAGTPLIVTRSGILAKRFPLSIPTVDVAINQDIKALIYDKAKLNTEFLVAEIESKEAYILNSIVKTGTTVQSINIPDLKKMILNIPMIEEQEQIGSFFNQLDDTITLHQRKFDLLKQLKQVYLKKLFPRNSETVSELRFADFKDKWEQRKLGEIAEIVRGASPRPIQDPKWFDPNSDIGWLRISDVTEQNGRIRKLEQKISKAGQQKTRVLETPHLLLSIAATVGKPVMNYVKTGVHDGFLIFLNPEFNTEFVFQWLEMFRPQWRKYGQPGSQVNLNSELVQNQKILLPSVEEQKKIAIFFEELDKNITLHKNKLDQLKQLKSAFLQKMFI